MSSRFNEIYAETLYNEPFGGPLCATYIKYYITSLILYIQDITDLSHDTR